MADNSSTGDKPKLSLGLSGTQTIGSAMAAVTSALVGSFLGVAGTLLGAALGSIVATVGGALYSRTLKSATDVAKVRIPRRNRRGLTADGADDGEANTGETMAASAPAEVAGATDDQPARAGKKLTPKTWIKIASVSVGAFAIAMVGITAVEFGTQQPISSLVSTTTGIDTGTSKQKTTTLGRVLTGNQSPADKAEESTEPADEVPGQTEDGTGKEGTNNDSQDADGTPVDGDSGSVQIVEPETGESDETPPADLAPETEPAPVTDPKTEQIPEPKIVTEPGSAKQGDSSGDDGAVGTGK
ncbi:hypothetical protein [Paeniglutamicibacter kerguelensis]|uniref:YtxH domain-containing protein n=1 Tax=Paeniglutamicibacter kerguelensis TaxID=254788 RepID=A0ABS4XC73_9MICC|nr:hypothetical protein [Paeniglutamicibacter kerguelensis]MBP2386074.1 hypothetical protein [Paeniglutamicibacter kerguelensis]